MTPCSSYYGTIFLLKMINTVCTKGFYVYFQESKRLINGQTVALLITLTLIIVNHQHKVVSRWRYIRACGKKCPAQIDIITCAKDLQVVFLKAFTDLDEINNVFIFFTFQSHTVLYHIECFNLILIHSIPNEWLYVCPAIKQLLKVFVHYQLPKHKHSVADLLFGLFVGLFSFFTKDVAAATASTTEMKTNRMSSIQEKNTNDYTAKPSTENFQFPPYRGSKLTKGMQ